MRIDNFLYINNFCSSRTKAQNLIKEGRVTVNGIETTKPSFEVSDSDKIEIIKSEVHDYVGRGGLKLEHAIKTFNISVKDCVCVDIGASTGGFTECLLLCGASKVYAVDSGKDQLDYRLKKDGRVVSIEGFNARYLTSADINDEKADAVVMDVSFISQTLLYPAILSVAKHDADVITLIKPQFEAGKQALGKHGVIKDEKTRIMVVENIIKKAEEIGFHYISHCVSPIKGGEGNIEYLLHLKVK